MKLFLLKLYLHFRTLELQAGNTSGLNPKRLQWLRREVTMTKMRVHNEELRRSLKTLMQS